MKDAVYKCLINEKYTVIVTADTWAEAHEIAKEFYLKNNYFIDNKVNKMSSKVLVTKEKIINLK